ncbi:hypothetical protein [Nocardia xishanensis]
MVFGEAILLYIVQSDGHRTVMRHQVWCMGMFETAALHSGRSAGTSRITLSVTLETIACDGKCCQESTSTSRTACSPPGNAELTVTGQPFTAMTALPYR